MSDYFLIGVDAHGNRWVCCGANGKSLSDMRREAKKRMKKDGYVEVEIRKWESRLVETVE